MGNIEHAPQEPQSIEEAISRFLNGEVDVTVSFLRAHKDEAIEFCLQVQDRYQKNDVRTPIIQLGQLIKALL